MLAIPTAFAEHNRWKKKKKQQLHDMIIDRLYQKGYILVSKS
jgi:hypothetical protein